MWLLQAKGFGKTHGGWENQKLTFSVFGNKVR